MKIKGFRTIGGQYLYYMACTSPTRKQTAPFILISKEAVTEITHSGILFEKAKNEDIILHAWPGKWRTDTFAYSFQDLKNLMAAYKISFLDFGKLTTEHYTRMYTKEDSK